MIIKNEKGMYFVERNYRDAYNEEQFIEKYIEECYDKYPYLVGDVSSGILRLKGFNNDPKGPDYIGNVDDYLETSCAIGCAYYLLKRLKSDEEYEKYLKKETITTSDIHITPIQKVAFDKEQLVLESNPKKTPNIVLDIDRVNTISKPNVSADVLAFIKEDKQASMNQSYRKSEVKEEPKEENVTTYVSGSADFDPSKKKDFGRNNFNKNNNKNNNNNNRNNQNNQNKNNQNYNNNKNNQNNKNKNRNK